jgi:hypothetical protein
LSIINYVVLIPCLTLFQAKLFESREKLELLLYLNVWNYGKPAFEKITKEVNILIKKAKHIRRHNYTTEQNLEPLKVRYKGFKNPWLLTKKLQKEPIIVMGHDLVQAC